MTHTHTLAEWAALLDLAVSGYASFSVFYFLFVEAKPCDFDPRPAARRLVESGRLDALLIGVGPVKADACALVAAAREYARLSLRSAAISLAALLMLLTSAPGGSR